MITLEQIRLLEGKITRALDLVRTLREENAALRQGLTSAQKRMRELETLVDGLKTDQKEIESIIVRTLHNLDDLEETAAATGSGISAAAGPSTPGGAAAGQPAAAGRRGERATSAGGAPAAGAGGILAPPYTGQKEPATSAVPTGGAGTPPEGAAGARPSTEELDIF